MCALMLSARRVWPSAAAIQWTFTSGKQANVRGGLMEAVAYVAGESLRVDALASADPLRRDASAQSKLRKDVDSSADCSLGGEGRHLR
jgi:hypothetical protein